MRDPIPDDFAGGRITDTVAAARCHDHLHVFAGGDQVVDERERVRVMNIIVAGTLGNQQLSENEICVRYGSRLTRRPAEITSAEEMQMEMEDRLACARAVVEDRTIAGEKVALPGDVCSGQL